MERMLNVGVPDTSGKLKPAQIIDKSSWTTVPDNQTALSAVHKVTMRPYNGSTITRVNPLDPGDGADTNWHEPTDMQSDPGYWGAVIPAGRGW